MALKLLQPGNQPLGQFDGLDTDLLSLKGGEVVTFLGTVVPPGDKAASDSFDGYLTPSSRPVVALVKTGTPRPLMLADEGISGYGTLFGTVVGGTVGQVATGGTVLGPHTTTGSGKVTCWDKPGLYAVSLDAVDTAVSTGLTPTNTGLAVGAPLYPNASGVLTTTGGTGAQTGNLVGRFVEFVSNGSLVNTPNSLVAALNSPSGNVTSVGPKTYAFVVIHFNPALT